MSSPGAEQVTSRHGGRALAAWLVAVLVVLMLAGGMAGFVWHSELRSMLGLDPETELVESARELLARAQDAQASQALDALRDLEAFLDRASESELAQAKPGLGADLAAQRARLGQLVEKQADDAAKAAVVWARTSAGYDPHETLAELNRLDAHFLGRIQHPPFHRTRERIQEQVASIEAQEGNVADSIARDDSVTRAPGPFATLVREARERTAETAGLAREAPRSGQPRADASADVEVATHDASTATDSAEEDTSNDWDEWLVQILIPAVLIGLIVMLVLILLVGGLPI